MRTTGTDRASEGLPQWGAAWLSRNFLGASQSFTCAHVFVGRNPRVWSSRSRPSQWRMGHRPLEFINSAPSLRDYLKELSRKGIYRRAFLLIYSRSWVVKTEASTIIIHVSAAVLGQGEGIKRTRKKKTGTSAWFIKLQTARIQLDCTITNVSSKANFSSSVSLNPNSSESR